MSNKRKDILSIGEYYHVFNKSIAGFALFNNLKDLSRALNILSFYKYSQTMRYSFYQRLNIEDKLEYLKNIHKKNPCVDIIAYAFMPNHYHLILKQLTENGIKTYISNFQNSYAKFYNIKYDRLGTVFLSPFKAKHISTDNELLHISRYIHLNPVTAYIIEFPGLKSYPNNSFKEYLSKSKSDLINTNIVLNLSGSRERYQQFVKDRVNYQRELKRIEHLIME